MRKNILKHFFRFRILILQIFSCAGGVFFSTIILTQGEKFVQNRVEPPILISRLMTFVLASAVVVLGVLVLTITNMFPLNRPQVFFLTTEVRDNQDIKLVEMPPQDENLDIYKGAFIREYVRARNEVLTNAKVMQKKWGTESGIVKNWSTNDVYAQFADTQMFNAMMSGMPNFDFRCNVGFLDKQPMKLVSESRQQDVYQVKIRYFCEDNTGPTSPKDYTIKIKLGQNDDVRVKWADRIDNPLGLHVAGYEILSDNGDPLDTGFLP